MLVNHQAGNIFQAVDRCARSKEAAKIVESNEKATWVIAGEVAYQGDRLHRDMQDLYWS